MFCGGKEIVQNTATKLKKKGIIIMVVDVGSKEYGTKVFLQKLATEKNLYYRKTTLKIIETFIPSMYEEFCSGKNLLCFLIDLDHNINLREKKKRLAQELLQQANKYKNSEDFKDISSELQKMTKCFFIFCFLFIHLVNKKNIIHKLTKRTQTNRIFVVCFCYLAFSF